MERLYSSQYFSIILQPVNWKGWRIAKIHGGILTVGNIDLGTKLARFRSMAVTLALGMVILYRRMQLTG